MKILCTICARKGSKGVINKNIKIINGKELIYYTIKQAVKSRIFDKVVVSSDSKKILKLSKKFGADFVYLRNKSGAKDNSPKIPAIKELTNASELFYNTKFDFIMDLDVTSPLRTISDIKKSYIFFKLKKADILLSCCVSKKSPYFNIVEKKKGKIFTSKFISKSISRRQDAPITYDLNASIYIWKRKILENCKTLYTKRTVLFVMPQERSIDIDTKFDFRVVKSFLKKNV
jgi:CMP-N,N'-diacetyllegionaminic acid synthase